MRGNTALNLGTFPVSQQRAQKLVVNLTYDVQASPTVAITSIEPAVGYAPHTVVYREHDTVQLLDTSGKVLVSRSFTVPNVVTWDSFSPAAIAKGGNRMLTSTDFSIDLPQTAGARSVRILTADGTPITSKAIAWAPAPPSPLATRLRARLATTLAGLWRRLVPQTQAQQAGRVHVVFVGDGYATTSNGEVDPTFYDDVQSRLSALKSVEPFQSRWDTEFDSTMYILQDKHMFCSKDTATIDEAMKYCNIKKVKQQLDKHSIPYTIIVVLTNHPPSDEGFSSRPEHWATISRTTPPSSLVHELGHALGQLWDEYLVSTSNAPINGQLQQNCFAGSAPPDWQGLDDNSTYQQGCAFPNWLRSRPSIMDSGLRWDTYNPVSLHLLNQQISGYTGQAPPPDMSSQFLQPVPPLEAEQPAPTSTPVQPQQSPMPNPTSQAGSGSPNCPKPKAENPPLGLPCLDYHPYCTAFPNDPKCQGTWWQ